jgi:hypothetical protein
MQKILSRLLFFPLLLAGLLLSAGPAHAEGPPPPIPTYDPLATPALPENPGPADLGREVYYYHCMPCHGDLGQGLTDEFRMVWEEDHQDCWDSGCHGGRERDEGFPIPTIVPAVMGSADRLPGFTTQLQLFDYLEATHPPQAPGRLTDEQTWEIVAFLWAGNHKATILPTDAPTHTPNATAWITPSSTNEATATEKVNGPENAATDPGLQVCGVTVMAFSVGLAAFWQLTRRPFS